MPRPRKRGWRDSIEVRRMTEMGPKSEMASRMPLLKSLERRVSERRRHATAVTAATLRARKGDVLSLPATEKPSARERSEDQMKLRA